MKYNTLVEMKQQAKAFKLAYIKPYPKLAVWIEKQNNEFIILHSLAGKITNPLNKKQWVIN